MDKDTKSLIVLASGLLIFITIGYVIASPNTTQPPPLQVEPTSTVIEGITVMAGPVFTTHDENRLSALDGGKQRLWSCTDMIPVEGENYLLIPNPSVVKTIGAETPEQLGYRKCALIPESQWATTVEPVNN